jgi:hypothetical protein
VRSDQQAQQIRWCERLSSGAKVALGAVIPVVVILVVGLLCFFIHRRKTRAITKVDALAHATSPPPVTRTEDTVLIKEELLGLDALIRRRVLYA